ncbi:hypothetical protein RAA17_25850 [Komagataeibacter rhaeticus]|nr:hypothetical protein [Komagataeibacter rhaeticus]
MPLNMVQKWLGHAQLSTTAIYADAVGAEELGYRTENVGVMHFVKMKSDCTDIYRRLS